MDMQTTVTTLEEWDALKQEVDMATARGVNSSFSELRISSTTGWTGPTNFQLDELLGQLDATALEVLHLQRCGRLDILPGAITDLTNLKELVVCTCEHLAQVPPGMCALTALQLLSITSCKALETLPDDLTSGEHVGLTVVSFRSCSALESIPPCIGQLPGLQTLDLTNCTALIGLPTSMMQCPSLTSVQFTGCRNLEGAVGQKLLGDTGDTASKMREILKRLDRHRSVMKLANEQGRMLETLERLSWIAVLLATATFIGFLQPPFGTIMQGQQDQVGPTAEDKKDKINLKMPAANKAFFVLDTWSFLLSLASLVFVVVLSMPRVPSTCYKREAGRFWLLLVLAWGPLYAAVIAGCGAFVASAFAVYPWHHSNPCLLWPLLIPVVLGTVLLLLGVLFVVQRMFFSLNPGIECIAWGLAEIWQRDLPLHIICPCTGLISCIACEPCIARRQQDQAVQQGTNTTAPSPHANDSDDVLNASCAETCMAHWRSYLIYRNLISPRHTSQV